jgi:hypothetical protein
LAVVVGGADRSRSIDIGGLAAVTRGLQSVLLFRMAAVWYFDG